MSVRSSDIESSSEETGAELLLAASGDARMDERMGDRRGERPGDRMVVLVRCCVVVVV